MLTPQRRYARPELVKEYQIGANILLAHFHYCNKGWQPFTRDWDDPKTALLAELNAEQILFMKRTSALIKVKEAHFKGVQGIEHCEDQYYFVAQMFESDWTPRSTI